LQAATVKLRVPAHHGSLHGVAVYSEELSGRREQMFRASFWKDAQNAPRPPRSPGEHFFALGATAGSSSSEWVLPFPDRDGTAEPLALSGLICPSCVVDRRHCWTSQQWHPISALRREDTCTVNTYLDKPAVAPGAPRRRSTTFCHSRALMAWIRLGRL
jgi:hypothetical protein